MIDTFPDFLAYWEEYQSRDVQSQIDGWAEVYMSQWSELFSKQVDDYAADGYKWRDVARDRVFPDLGQRLPQMRIAHDILLEISPSLLEQAGQLFGWDGEVVTLLYVGIGLGAGWATTYDCHPAILFGLENIAECGWSSEEALSGLVAHEFGHLAHFRSRELAGLPPGSGPWWQLYSEGYAMRCEHLILGKESWHMRGRRGQGDWLEWCRSNVGWLAAEFLRRVENGESTRPFFGSWFDLQGYSQTGYFLGLQLIQALEKDMGLDEITTMADDDPRLVEEIGNLLNKTVGID